MPRLLVMVAIVGASSSAAADPIQLGGWFGPRLYSDDSSLGFIPEAPFHPDLESSIAFGGRIARPLLPWLVPEFELAIAPTRTTPTGADPVSVIWLDPRVHFRFELLPGRRLQPFVVVGAGAPIALSTAQKVFDSGIVGSAYFGGGVRFDTGRSFALRFDARLAIVPASEATLTTEVDVGLGIELQLGKRRSAATGERLAGTAGPDRDDDGIADARDGCPDRPEDPDGFEDLDGCPDIDNDVDEVLDIADRCAGVAETYNGFEDDDGCPDAVPPEVDGLRGTVEGLVYGDGETGVRNSALASLAKIAKVMLEHPSIRVVLVGHADDREAKQFATGTDGQSADVAALSIDLSRARAEAVKQALTGQGIAAGRVEVEGHGAEEPVADNARPRGRLANRRVEIKLYVPPRR